jgi:ATP-binding protein involved in chromosome partitioning
MTTAITVEQQRILDALKGVKDPELDRDLVELDMVRDIKVCGENADLTVYLTTPACPLKDQIKKQVADAISTRLPDIKNINIRMGSDVKSSLKFTSSDILRGVKNVVAVASGKGGVGKSTVSTNLALGLAGCGASVGLLDGDIYGPNIPMMLGKTVSNVEYRDQKLIPVEQYGIRFFSMGFLLKADQPVIWRGPMLHGVIQQFLKDIEWGDLDYLIIDLPPGTGDVQLSLSQSVALTGAVVVSTPQQVALSDVRKGIAMFRQVEVPILGIIENMSAFVCPNCRHETDVFLSGGAERMARELGIPFLGSIPLDRSIAEGGDAGVPVVARDSGSPLAQRFIAVARSLAAQVSIKTFAMA